MSASISHREGGVYFPFGGLLLLLLSLVVVMLLLLLCVVLLGFGGFLANVLSHLKYQTYARQ